MPDAVANQIAAGEVVQRPANAVKELLENSLDAGASKITLLIKDGGSTSIQVIDNGKGMSEMDARLCWERHATSKIRKADDLFKLKTYGFRGEAMASIAAVSQVEMKTRREEDDVAQYIRIEGSEVLDQRIDAAPIGSNISIKNLFYNIPARRNFLKSIAVETKHIVEEFLRQAMANPQVEFAYHNNGQLVYQLKAQPLKDRVIETMGKKNPQDFLSLDERTEIVNISGFVGCPGQAKRTRGDQYFFMNGRFIRSNYFHHAVVSAYQGLIDADAHPIYAIYLQVEPSKVDVNVHPTKTEVKFEDEKHIYNLIKAAVRKSLGRFVVHPNMALGDFQNFETFLNQPIAPRNNETSLGWNKSGMAGATEKYNPSYNPFGNQSDSYQRNSHQDWQKVLGSVDHSNHDTLKRSSFINHDEGDSLDAGLNFGTVHPQDGTGSVGLPISGMVGTVFSLGQKYLVANVQEKLLVIDAKVAQQHVFYHEYLQQIDAHSGYSQQLLFPRTIELSPAQIPLVLELMDELKSLGFDISHFGGNTLIVNGLPATLNQGDEQKLIEQLLEDYHNTQGELRLNKHQSMALSMARHAVLRSGMGLSAEEMLSLIHRLFALASPNLTFEGKTVYIEIGAAQLFDRFNANKYK